MSFFVSKIWNFVSNEFKKEILDPFKKIVKKWQTVQLKTVHVNYVNHACKISVLFLRFTAIFLSIVFCIVYGFCYCIVFYLVDRD